MLIAPPSLGRDTGRGMDQPVVFRLLGTFEAATAAGQPLALGGPRQQVVLAALLVAHPEPVPNDRLADVVWGDDVPPTAITTLQVYISRLRKLLAPTGVRLTSGSRGYQLEVDAQSIDAYRFDAAVRDAVDWSQDERYGEVVDRLEPALDLWRSPQVLGPLSDAAWAAQFAARATERRGVAEELLADAYLALGAHVTAVLRLEAATMEWPWREPLAQRLMVALYRSGRQVDALAVYDRVRRALHDEIGLAPSEELRDVHHAVLNHSPSLTWTSPRARPAARVLPPRNPLFTGRSADVVRVRQLLIDHGVVTVHGLGGVGKTEVAIEVAHKHDGPVAWITAESRTALLGALTAVARRLNVTVGSDESDLLGSLWAAMKEHDDWLLVYDNAEDIDLVRELLPPLPNVTVLVTSQGSAWSALGPTVRLEPFAPDVAARFVLARSGRRDPHAAAQLSELLGNLPLALEQAAAYVDETGLSLAEYLRLFQLRRDQLLMRGAPSNHRETVSTTWQIVFDRVLARSPVAARVLEVSAFLAPDAIPLDWLTAICTGPDAELEFADAVAELLRYSLVDRGEGTLRVHRLVQTVVRARLTSDERVARAAAAVALLRRVAPADPADLAAWSTWASLAAHVTALLGSVDDLTALPDELAGLSLDAFRYLRARSSLAAAHSVLDTLIDVVQRASGEPVLLGELHAERGELFDAEGDLAAARDELGRALAMIGADTEPGSLRLARVWARLAHLLNCADEADRAVEFYQRSLPILIDEGETSEIVRADIGLGYTYWALDEFANGAEQFRHALAALEQAGWRDHPLAAEAMSGLGMMRHDQGYAAESRDLQQRALAVLARVHGDVDHPVVAEVHDKLGWVCRLLGDPEAAQAEHTQSAEMMSRLFGPDDPRVAMALTNLGLAKQDAGDAEAARTTQNRAYDILVRAYGPEHRNTRLVFDRLRVLDDLSVAGCQPGRTMS
jgi:DNA-binding SARP family transcriptional activator